MTRRASVFAICLAGGAASMALAEPLECHGVDPDWTLSVAGDGTGTFAYGDVFEMEIPQETSVEGGEFPKAMTLIGNRQTAILVLEERTCETPIATGLPYRAVVLSQKGETPVLLVGCCETLR